VDKNGIYQVFSEYGLFEILEEIMLNPQTQHNNQSIQKDTRKHKKDFEEIDNEKHQHIILEIIMLSLVQVPQLLRDFCLSQTEKIQKYPLFTYMIDKCTTHQNPTIQNMVKFC